MPLITLEVFLAIARHGSLRAAAAALGLKPSTISHQLKSLEDQLETTLFIRSTRALSLTEAGRALLRGSDPAFQQLAVAVETARNTGRSARGTLKLTMPDFVYHLVVGPALKSFSAAYPDIKLELSVTDAFSDILGEELHAGFRLGDRIAPDMVAVRLTPPLKLAVLGSPAYFSAHGLPSAPTDLLGHNCIRYRFQTSGRIYPWSFIGEEGEYCVQVDGTFTVNTLPSVIDLAVNGLGLAYTFRDFAIRELESAALVSVLEPQALTVPGLHMYFPGEYRSMVPLRLFLDHLKAQTAFGGFDHGTD
ncbi:LysR family transcriptional regulator [Ciceribacter sp. L1K22]|uniref:LysR family transcriptional regulator n=1 Tax=Ciceribacter sp. L1K22 TaxID=2820275 RepID=UPI001ABDC479|nr:LysR family transcriptional regulator [Ciceribacter sp. L1K22]MBO3760935.1 LysR family transcriptional regulator [Ciceribacter sp. L1K22]